jgi:hypothetical protein
MRLIKTFHIFNIISNATADAIQGSLRPGGSLSCHDRVNRVQFFPKAQIPRLVHLQIGID